MISGNCPHGNYSAACVKCEKEKEALAAEIWCCPRCGRTNARAGAIWGCRLCQKRHVRINK